MDNMDNEKRNVRKLYRSRRDRIIGGVGGGLADYFAVDPLLVRAAFIIASFIGGSGIIAYILFMLLVPQESAIRDGAQDASSGRSYAGLDQAEDIQHSRNWAGQRRNAFALGLIALGLILFANEIFPIRLIRWDLFWPLLLVFIGFSVIVKNK